MIEFYKEEGMFYVEADGMALQLSREESEQLFTDIGHILHDDDIERYGNESDVG